MISTLLDWLLPGRCVLCHQLSQNAHQSICQICLTDITPRMLPLEQNLLALPGIRRDLTIKHLDYLVSLAHYQWPFDHWITRLKFHRNHLFGHLTGQLLAKRINIIHHQHSYPLPNLIIPLPLHQTRSLIRGYNQAEVIARQLSALLDIPMDNSVLVRSKSTSAQTLLTAAQRRRNVKNAFKLTGQLHQYRHIALVDDVITTGSTIEAACRVLRKEGVKHISVWTVCITPKS